MLRDAVLTVCNKSRAQGPRSDKWPWIQEQMTVAVRRERGPFVNASHYRPSEIFHIRAFWRRQVTEELIVTRARVHIHKCTHRHILRWSVFLCKECLAKNWMAHFERYVVRKYGNLSICAGLTRMAVVQCWISWHLIKLKGAYWTMAIWREIYRSA